MSPEHKKNGNASESDGYVSASESNESTKERDMINNGQQGVGGESPELDKSPKKPIIPKDQSDDTSPQAGELSSPQPQAIGAGTEQSVQGDNVSASGGSQEQLSANDNHTDGKGFLGNKPENTDNANYVEGVTNPSVLSGVHSTNDSGNGQGLDKDTNKSDESTGAKLSNEEQGVTDDGQQGVGGGPPEPDKSPEKSIIPKDQSDDTSPQAGELSSPQPQAIGAGTEQSVQGDNVSASGGSQEQLSANDNHTDGKGFLGNKPENTDNANYVEGVTNPSVLSGVHSTNDSGNGQGLDEDTNKSDESTGAKLSNEEQGVTDDGQQGVGGGSPEPDKSPKKSIIPKNQSNDVISRKSNRVIHIASTAALCAAGFGCYSAIYTPDAKMLLPFLGISVHRACSAFVIAGACSVVALVTWYCYSTENKVQPHVEGIPATNINGGIKPSSVNGENPEQRKKA